MLRQVNVSIATEKTILRITFDTAIYLDNDGMVGVVGAYNGTEPIAEVGLTDKQTFVSDMFVKIRKYMLRDKDIYGDFQVCEQGVLRAVNNLFDSIQRELDNA